MKTKVITLENVKVQYHLSKDDIKEGFEMVLGVCSLILGTSFLAIIIRMAGV